MFAFNSMMSKKRGREDDDEPSGPAAAQWWMGSPPMTKRIRNSVDGLTINVNGSLAQHQQHRPSLPHHATSFRLRPQIDSPLMNQDSEQTPTAPAFSTGSSPNPSPPHAIEPADMDMEGDSTVVSIVQSSPPSPWNVPILGRPPKRSPPPLRSMPADRFTAGRVPTPIYSSFPANAQQSPQSHAANGFTSGFSQPSRLPSLNTAIHTLQRRDHIMPSPVREADDEMEAEYAFAGSQLSRLSFSSGTGPDGVGEDLGMDLDDMDIPSQPSSLSYNWTQSTPDRYDDHTISPLSRSPNLNGPSASRSPNLHPITNPISRAPNWTGGNLSVFSRKEGQQQNQSLPQSSSLPFSSSPGMMSPPLMSPRTGRARSGAMSLASPTALISEGIEGRAGGSNARKFAFGYRDDCEKCRARVAGHYAHFL